MRNKKIGIILIAVGICLPLALLAFVSGYKDGAGFINNLFGMKVIVATSVETNYPAASHRVSNARQKHETISKQASGYGPAGQSNIGIPYRFILAIGVALVFFGIRSIDIAKAGSKGKDKPD